MFLRNLFGKRRPALHVSHLRTQLFRADYAVLRMLGDRAATRTLAPGLVEALVEDIGGDERALRWDDLTGFEEDREQLFARAREQAAASDDDVKATVVADYVDVVASSGSYLSAHLLDQFRRHPGKHGVLFVPVSSHHWCVHVLHRMSVPALVALMRLVADDVAALMRVGDAETLPRELYWYKPDHTIERIAVTGAGAELRSTSPELERAFDRVLDG